MEKYFIYLYKGKNLIKQNISTNTGKIKYRTVDSFQLKKKSWFSNFTLIFIH